MSDVTASRTLVKSPPELWTECSDAASLARHLDGFGEIRITRLEPETTVAWEGEHASGTVRLEPAGWGTRVVLTAKPAGAPGGPIEEEVEREGPFSGAEHEADGEPVESEPDSAAVPERRPRLFRRLIDALRGRREPVAEDGAAADEHEPPQAGAAVDEHEAPLAGAAVDEHEAPLAGAGAVEHEAPQAGAGAVEPAAADASAALAAALDSLGQAHHRPFSRA